MADDLRYMPTAPEEEIARLKDLLSFATREGSSTLRAEIRFQKDDGPILCLTCPSRDEKAIARIVLTHLAAIWRDAARDKFQERVCGAIRPLVDVVQSCKHLDEVDDGVCRRCIGNALRLVAAFVNDEHSDADEPETDATLPSEKQPSDKGNG